MTPNTIILALLNPIHTQLDMSLLQYQNVLNGGKCGVCGDPWGKPNPQFVAGGKYANGIITRTYKEGQVRKRNHTFNLKKYFHWLFLWNNFWYFGTNNGCATDNYKNCLAKLLHLSQMKRIHARHCFIAYLWIYCTR